MRAVMAATGFIIYATMYKAPVNIFRVFLPTSAPLGDRKPASVWSLVTGKSLFHFRSILVGALLL